jgi:hypothetical protein
MKRIFRHKSAAEIALVRGILEKRGIRCITKHEQLSSIFGSLPIIEQELWVVENHDLGPALMIVKEHLARLDDAPEWRCSNCGESNEGQFAVCWQCGEPDETGRPG